MPHSNFLMRSYPKIKRNLDEREKSIDENVRNIARKFEKDFFDGERKYGYGGYKYDGRWIPVVKDFIEFYNLNENSSVLDIGAGKGFMMKDFLDSLPGAKIKGIDVSNYAVKNCHPDVINDISVGNAKKLNFLDKSFDLVISINTLHNLEIDEFKIALSEMLRVTKKNSFLVLDAYSNEDEKKRLMSWNLTAKTILHIDEWIKIFKELGYKGEYDWFVP